MAFWQIISFYPKNRTKSVGTLCVQNTEFLNIKAGDAKKLA
jgi:hypothetical protein